MNDIRHVSELFVGYLDRYPFESAAADFDAVVARSRAYLAGPAEMAAAISAAITERRPFAAIRLGDGEGNVLAGGEPDEAELRAWAQQRILRNMFGRDDFPEGEVTRLREDLRRAVLAADILALRTPQGLERNYAGARDRRGGVGKIKNARGHLGAVESVRMTRSLLDREDRHPPMTARFSLHMDLLPEYAALLRDLDFVGLVSRSDILGPALERAFGVGRCEAHVVPGQAKSEFRSNHFPDVFDRLSDDLRVPYPGAVFLVGAGVLGKAYCALLKARGAVALDIGSVVDVWLGDGTRANVTADMLERWRLVR